ncbi:MAG: hypothetical protein FWE95_06155, partial [Planctomycetaceae bacterium]|nr:hypothetical protein [Planctomycetaceae bacterium]
MAKLFTNGKLETLATQEYVQSYTGSASDTDNGGGYAPPKGGIPKADLSDEVQNALNLAATALQSFTETDPVYAAEKANLAKLTGDNTFNGNNTHNGNVVIKGSLMVNDVPITGEGGSGGGGGLPALANFKDKKWLVIGDSISAENDRWKQNYSKLIADWLGMEEPTNVAVSGTGLVTAQNNWIDKVAGYPSEEQVGMITAMLSFND